MLSLTDSESIELREHLDACVTGANVSDAAVTWRCLSRAPRQLIGATITSRGDVNRRTQVVLAFVMAYDG